MPKLLNGGLGMFHIYSGGLHTSCFDMKCQICCHDWNSGSIQAHQKRWPLSENCCHLLSNMLFYSNYSVIYLFSSSLIVTTIFSILFSTIFLFSKVIFFYVLS